MDVYRRLSLNIKKALWICIPFLAVIAALSIGGYFMTRADQLDSFNINGSTLLGYSGTESEITIPSKVTTIGANAFANNELIKSVKIEEGVARIESGAFANCKNLEKITLANTVSSIGDSAFDNCENLSEVIVGDGLYSLGAGAFSGCTKLNKLEISPNNSSIKCNGSAVLNSNDTVLYQYLAGSNDVKYKVPDTVKEVKKYAFWGCNKLKQIDLSSGIQKVDQYSLANCAGLENVIIHEPTREIAIGAFANDSSLKQVIVPISITSIHDSAFTAVSSNEVTFICDEGSYAYNYANNNGFQVGNQFNNIEVPESSNATDENNGVINEIELDNNSNDVQIDDTHDDSEKAALSDTFDTITDNLSQGIGNFINSSSDVSGELLGNGTIVSDRVFVMMNSPEVIDGKNATNNLGKDSKIIGNKLADYAYYKNNAINNMDYDNWGVDAGTVNDLGQFSYARSSISEAKITNGTKRIEYGAFYHCDSLNDVEIPSTVEYIGGYAFEHTPWLQNWYKDASKSDYLIVGDGVLIAYKGEEEVPTIPENVKYIAAYAFKDNKQIKDIILLNKNVAIDEYAFDGCSVSP